MKTCSWTRDFLALFTLGIFDFFLLQHRIKQYGFFLGESDRYCRTDCLLHFFNKHHPAAMHTCDDELCCNVCIECALLWQCLESFYTEQLTQRCVQHFVSNNVLFRASMGVNWLKHRGIMQIHLVNTRCPYGCGANNAPLPNGCGAILLDSTCMISWCCMAGVLMGQIMGHFFSSPN